MCWVCRWWYIHSDIGFHRHTVPYPTAGLSAHTDRLGTLHTSPLKWVGVLDKPQPSHKTSGDTLPTTGVTQRDNCHMAEGPRGTNRNLELTNNDFCPTADSTIRLLPRHRLTAGLLPFSGPLPQARPTSFVPRAAHHDRCLAQFRLTLLGLLLLPCARLTSYSTHEVVNT
jgi:hypothetical protein